MTLMREISPTYSRVPDDVSSEENIDEEFAKAIPKHEYPWRKAFVIIFLQLAFNITLIAVGFHRYSIGTGPKNPIFPQLSYCTFQSTALMYYLTTFVAPAQDAIRYELKIFYTGFWGDVSGFQGYLTPEIDAAWESLYGDCA